MRPLSTCKQSCGHQARVSWHRQGVNADVHKTCRCQRRWQCSTSLVTVQANALEWATLRQSALFEVTPPCLAGQDTSGCDVCNASSIDHTWGCTASVVAASVPRLCPVALCLPVLCKGVLYFRVCICPQASASAVFGYSQV
jgi:hypothetical protein